MKISRKTGGILILAGSSFLLLAVGIVPAQLHDRRIEDEERALLGASRHLESTAITEQDLDELPEPVQRWLRWAGVVGKPRVSTVRLTQKGDFRLAPDRSWMPFTAVQHYTIDPPGFIWTVSMKMFPFVEIAGRDKYEDGEGSIDMRVLSLVPVAKKAGGELNQGAALRYLNEIMWFPTAALSPAITWTEDDANSAIAIFSHVGITVTAQFFFDADGRIVNMTASRYNDEQGEILPWSTPIDGYGEFAGIRIPVEGRGIWEYSDGSFEYIRLTIQEVEYDPPA